MLVLGRKIGEAICIGDQIKLTVQSISGNRVRVGIDAPKDVRIMRSEVTQIESCVKASRELASASDGWTNQG